MAETKTIYVIGGPTASGKSALALKLAAEKNGVIINADSVQIYDALPILTAQPSAEDKVRAPHELYGILHPDKASSAGKWRDVAETLIHSVLDKGQTPIVVGGSGLYIKALIEGFAPIPDIPDDVRERAIALQEELGNPGFHAELQKRDRVMAERFHPQHTARLIRAWEVIEATGRSLADWQEEPNIMPPEDWAFDVTLVMPEREELRRRCDMRFDLMLDSGALEEVEALDALIESGEVTPDALITRALGFKPLRSYLKGEISKEEAIEKSQTETRQYAKRQTTWFKHQIKPSEKTTTKIL